MPIQNIIVVGASAGGIKPVGTLLSNLSEDIPAALFVVVHISPEGPGMLATVLSRVTKLTVVDAEDGAPIRNGSVYVAPPDYHLLIEGQHVRLSHGPREHRFRPAVDPLFRSAAEHHRRRVIGVVLSGHMADGTHGLKVIKDAGGVSVVQDPDEAEARAMPLNAMRRGNVDYVLPVEEMGRVIMGLLMNVRSRPARGRSRPPSKETPSADQPGTDALRSGTTKGKPSPFTCPDCGGALWEITEGGLVRYRCHVGHGFNRDSLREGMDDKLEDTLWSALRSMEENIELRSRMVEQSKQRRLTEFTGTLEKEIADRKKKADALRELLMDKSEATRDGSSRKRQAHG